MRHTFVQNLAVWISMSFTWTLARLWSWKFKSTLCIFGSFFNSSADSIGFLSLTSGSLDPRHKFLGLPIGGRWCLAPSRESSCGRAFEALSSLYLEERWWRFITGVRKLYERQLFYCFPLSLSHLLFQFLFQATFLSFFRSCLGWPLGGVARHWSYVTCCPLRNTMYMGWKFWSDDNDADGEDAEDMAIIMNSKSRNTFVRVSLTRSW
jgi:hypothetical protein